MASSVSSSGLAETLRLIPGYDPFATAGDCWLDEDAARLAIDFFPECLKHIEGALAGEPFTLEPWQQAVVGNLFGWKRKDAKGRAVRRYREALVYVPRKNGKTPMAAGIACYVLFCDDETGQQNYCAAADREQAGMLFRHAKGMVEREPELNDRCRIYGGTAQAGQSKSIVREDEGSFLRVISADADTKHGGNSHLVIVDELHAQPNRDLVDVLQTSLASENRKQPLLLHVTTADFDRESICNEKYNYASKVRDGIIEDQSFLPVIYEASLTDDWTDPKVWAKANPNLGVSISREYLERETKKAKEMPAYENTFKRLHLDIRTQQDVLWLPMPKWDRCGDGADPAEWRERMLEELRGRDCHGGLDLASTQDTTALVLTFRLEGRVVLMPFFWVPAENAEQRERRDRVPYLTWARQGFIKLVEGNVMDYDVVRADINELNKSYHIKRVAIDRWNATHLSTQLMADGIEVEAFGQGYASMSAPTKELERLMLDGSLAHGANPVLRWMASNVSVETDAAGNLKPSKKKSTERIDGIVSGVMAIGLEMLEPEGQSIYESEGSLSL